MTDHLTPVPQEHSRGVLDRARDALTALEHVIGYAAGLEAERDKLIRWHREDNTQMTRACREAARLRAERDQAQAELAKYVGKEPTVVEEMTHLNHCLNAVYDLCGEAKRSNSLCITIEAVEHAADGARADDPNDNRRRIYIDGNGRAWIDTGVDNGGFRWIASIDDRAMEATREAVTAETGSLREIGRCW